MRGMANDTLTPNNLILPLIFLPPEYPFSSIDFYLICKRIRVKSKYSENY